MNTQSEFKGDTSAGSNLQFSICNLQFSIPYSIPASSLRPLASVFLAVLCVLASLPALPGVAASPRPRVSPFQEPRRPQQPSQQAQPYSQHPGVANSPNILFSLGEDYRIGPSDVLEIVVEDAPELSGIVRVSANGTFPMPFLGRILAQQKTPEELEKLIAHGLRNEYLKDPKVTVVVRQYNSRSFFIQGAVKMPGVYQIEGKPSLLKLITMAGGLAENHGSTAFIIREIKPKPDSAPEVPDEPRASTLPPPVPASQPPSTSAAPPASGAQTQDSGPEHNEVDDAKYELRTANINSLLVGNFKQNLVIVPGDIINIPPTDVFFVAGEVRSPGSFALREGTTLRQAISLAQGLTGRAAASRGVVFRTEPGTGKRQEIKVDINDVMRGKKEDMTVLANDIIIVPNSRFKSVGGTMLNAFGMSATRIPVY